MGTLSSRILRAILLVSLVTAAICSATAIWALYDTIGVKEQRDLRNSLLLIEQGLPQGASQDANRTAYLSSLGTEEIRVTWIAADGTVLYDSRSENAALMDSHADRPEVIEALAKGEGSSSRLSATYSEVTYYHALRLDDGTVLRLSSAHNTAFSVLSRLVIPGILLFIVVVLAAVLISQWIARRTIAPLNDINLDDPLQDEMYFELEPLLKRIEEQRERIQRQTREVEEQRRAFVSNVSHELKTPLTVIAGYAELLKAGSVEPQDVPEVSALIFEEAGYMRGLVDDVLALSQLDEYTATGNTTTHALRVDLATVAGDVLARLAPFAEQNQVLVDLVCTGDTTIYGLERVLTGIVYNLSENAIRYNRPDGEVRIELSGNADEVSLMVADTGIGIADEEQPRVFERFYRVDQAHSRESGGTGLGLAIVKHGAFYHRASITLESRLDEGTTITVRFPRLS
ncbi:MAG: ATP-binding protein [Coriobacteriia bacterium]|nr:ATP-binding protein [Coriobacteriia bacterium]